MRGSLLWDTRKKIENSNVDRNVRSARCCDWAVATHLTTSHEVLSNRYRKIILFPCIYQMPISECQVSASLIGRDRERQILHPYLAGQRKTPIYINSDSN